MLKYRDNVKIVSGFYEGFSGVVVEEHLVEYRGYDLVEYEVEFNTGIEHINRNFTEDKLQRIK